MGRSYTDDEIDLIKKAAYYEGYADGVKDALLQKQGRSQAPPISDGLGEVDPPRPYPRMPRETVVTMYGVRSDFSFDEAKPYSVATKPDEET